MKTIEIDDAVWHELQKRAIPFVDTPNTVLRKLLNLGRLPINFNTSINQSPDFNRVSWAKKELIKKLSEVGITARLLKGIVYQIDQSAFMAIPTANEINTNRWFLGIGEDIINRYRPIGIIFHCISNQSTYPFVMSLEQWSALSPLLSKDKNDQFKINIVRRNNTFEFLIPNKTPIDITDLLNNFSTVKSVIKEMPKTLTNTTKEEIEKSPEFINTSRVCLNDIYSIMYMYLKENIGIRDAFKIRAEERSVKEATIRDACVRRVYGPESNKGTEYFEKELKSGEILTTLKMAFSLSHDDYSKFEKLFNDNFNS